MQYANRQFDTPIYRSNHIEYHIESVTESKIIQSEISDEMRVIIFFYIDLKIRILPPCGNPPKWKVGRFVPPARSLRITFQV